MRRARKLANMINEAALRAVRSGRDIVTQADLEESVEVVIAGYQKKNKILSDHEKMIVSYHEIGQCSGGRTADAFGAGDQDHDYSQDFRCVRLYHAGG